MRQFDPHSNASSTGCHNRQLNISELCIDNVTQSVENVSADRVRATSVGSTLRNRHTPNTKSVPTQSFDNADFTVPKTEVLSFSAIAVPARRPKVRDRKTEVAGGYSANQQSVREPEIGVTKWQLTIVEDTGHFSGSEQTRNGHVVGS